MTEHTPITAAEVEAAIKQLMTQRAELVRIIVQLRCATPYEWTRLREGQQTIETCQAILRELQKQESPAD
jgi:hypothetical protein